MCPGWMYVPRKPHHFGNEYHTICCGYSGVLFDLELVEGKDAPKEIPSDPTNRCGNTVGLLLRLTSSIYNTGRIIVLDSGFCILQGIIELRKLGLFAHAVIKKRRYWPRYVKGNDIDAHMSNMDVGTQQVMSGKLDSLEFYIYNMKEPAFNMKVMSTYGDLNIPENSDNTRRFYKNNEGNFVERFFRYTTIFYNHFRFRHLIDDHNNLRHQSPSLEETWVTHRWPNRVFSFVLAVAEVNAFVAFRFFCLAATE